MGEGKNQHFVPQFYLRRFAACADGRSVGAYLVDRDAVVDAASIKGQCSKNFFYGHDLSLERMLGSLEGTASHALDAVSKFEFDRISRLEWELLYAYICVQLRRTSFAYEQDKQMWLAFEEAALSPGPEDTEFPEELRAPETDASTSTKMGLRMYPHIMDLDFCVIQNRTKIDFVTSDHPIVLFNKAGEQGKVQHDVGLGSAGILLMFPIDPRTAIFLYDRGIYRTKHRQGVIPTTRNSDVQRINKLQVLNCHKSIYFSNFRRIEVESLRKYRCDRQSKRVEAIALVPTSDANGAEVYEEYIGQELNSPLASSMVVSRYLPLQTNFRATFLEYRQNLRFTDTGTGAGCIRDESFHTTAEMYIADLKKGRAKIGDLFKAMTRPIN